MKQTAQQFNIVQQLSGLVAVLAIFSIPFVAQAETVVRTGNSVSISESQLVENDFYAYGGTVTHSGVIDADMYAIGGSVVINGPVGADLTTISGSAQVHSTVGDDVRIVAGEVVISDEVRGDVFVVGGVLNVLSSASIRGNVYFYGGQANIEGSVGGSVMGAAERFYINSEVDGGIDVTGLIELGDQAVVAGDLQYTSEQELSRSQNTVVEGNITRGSSQVLDAKSASDLPIATFFVWTFTALAVYLILRRNLGKFVRRLDKDMPRAALFGLIGVLFTPVLAAVLMVTVLGLWFGVLTLLIWVVLLLASMLLLPIFVGDRLMRFFRPEQSLNWVTVLVGVVVTVVLLQLPFLGGLLCFLGTTLIFGYLTLRMYRLVKDRV